MASYIYRELDRSGVNAANCTCTYCELRAGVNLPAPRNIDIDQLQTFAADFAQSIFDDWTALNAILKRHEVTIRKRWLKKGTAWRSNVLLTAQPHMPLYHRADFEGCGKSNDRGQGGVQRKRTFGAEAHLIPYINKKDLLHDHHLLLFLNSRGRNLPELFLKTEVEKAHLDVEWKAYYVPTTDADKYVMFFNFGISEMPRRYGYVTKRESLPPSIVRRAGVKPIYGLLLMEIQQKIYGFLLRCVQAILHDYDKIMLMQVPEQVEPIPLECNVVSKVGHHAVEADYRRPLEAANLGRLQLLVSSRREVAEDHMILLREDPGYFLDNLRAWREYYKDPGAKDSLPIWQRLASYMLGDALISLFTWTSLAIQLADMRPLDDQIASSNPRTYQLDAEDEKKWAALVSNIHWMQMNPMSKLRETIPRSSGLRAGLQEPHDHETCHANPKCPGPHGCESEWNLKQGASPAHHRVVLNFSMLAGVDPARLALHGLRAVVQETHHMLEHDHAARALIDPWLLTEFCDLAVFSDLEYCINMMQPYSCYLPTRNEPTDETVDNLKMIAELSVAASDGGHGVHGLGDPLDGRFHYPADKHRTAETVKQMRRAESALQDYWEKVAVSMKRYGIDLQLMLKDQMMTYTPLSCKTKAWDDQLTTLKKPAKVMERVKQQSNAVFTTPVGKENLKTVINLEEKLKPKTRGSPQDTVTVNPAPAANDPLEPRQPIAVPRRVFKVMSALLPSPATISEASREIAWKDFQFAFNAIGLVPEKLYGSDWLFKPLPKGEGLVSVNRSIHFHEPHSTRQGSKIDAQKVRHYGARLKRVFGWDGETFVCA